MRYLLDSHVLLWWMGKSGRLSAAHYDAIHDDANEIVVSAITVAEVNIKAALGKLDIPGDLKSAVEQMGFVSLPFTERHATALRDLPFHHRDPFDRMLICQAQLEGLVFLTVDDNCKLYDVQTR